VAPNYQTVDTRGDNQGAIALIKNPTLRSVLSTSTFNITMYEIYIIRARLKSAMCLLLTWLLIGFIKPFLKLNSRVYTTDRNGIKGF